MPQGAHRHPSQSSAGTRRWGELVLSVEGAVAGSPRILMKPSGEERVISVATGVQEAIEQIAAKACGRIVIPGLPPPGRLRACLSRLRRAHPSTAERVIQQLWDTDHSDMAGLLQALMQRPGLFGPISFSPGPEGRWTATSERRRIRNLLIVAAPTGAGKTTLMRRVIHPLSVTATRLLPQQNFLRQAQGAANAAVERLELPKGRCWQCVTGSKRLPALRRADCDYFLLQYELARADEEPDGLKRFEAVRDLISGAEHVSVITVWTRPELLNAQKAHRSRLRKPRKQLPPPVDGDALQKLYRDYLHSVEGLVEDHVIVEVAASPRILHPQEWLDLTAQSGD